MSRSERHQRLSGLVRTAVCLGMALLLLVGGAAYFLSGTPDGGAGVSDRDGPPGQQESGGVSGAGGSGDGSAGTAGMNATHSTDAEVDSRTAFGREDVPAGPDGVSPAGGDGSSRFADIVVSAGAEADAVLRSLGAGTGGRLAGGRLYDGATGQGLAGARILATAFHGTEDLRTAGTPARDQVALDVGSEGTFEIPVIDPEDPRLLVHLQIDHPDYLPTVTEVIEQGKEDCDGQAVVAASLLKNFGYDAQLVNDLVHMWVKTDKGETMSPGKAAVVVATEDGLTIRPPAITEISKALAFGIAVFPLVRELIVVIALWLLLLRDNGGLGCSVVSLVLRDIGDLPGVMRLGSPGGPPHSRPGRRFLCAHLAPRPPGLTAKMGFLRKARRAGTARPTPRRPGAAPRPPAPRSGPGSWPGERC